MTRERSSCEPASTIIRAVGGTAAVSAKVGVKQTTVIRWRIRSEKGGTGGFIPRKYHDHIREMAALKGTEMPLTAFFDPKVAAAIFPKAAA